MDIKPDSKWFKVKARFKVIQSESQIQSDNEPDLVTEQGLEA